MQPSRRPGRPGRPWQASGHDVPGAGPGCDRLCPGAVPARHARRPHGPPRARRGCRLPGTPGAYWGHVGRVIGTILGAILAIWLAVTVAGGIFATLKTFVIIGLIAMAVFIVVWLVARRPSGG